MVYGMTTEPVYFPDDPFGPAPQNARTLNDYAERVLRPSVLQNIRCGRCDSVICDPDVLQIASNDDELWQAICDRAKAVEGENKIINRLFGAWLNQDGEAV